MDRDRCLDEMQHSVWRFAFVLSPALDEHDVTLAGPLRSPWPLRSIWFWGILLSSHLPFFLLHLWNLWRYRPHYEFFPLVLAAAAWLMWRRWPRGAVQHTRLTRILGALLLMMGFGMLAGAVLLFSPWLGAIATLLSLGGVLLRMKGQSAWRELTGAWLLLWLVIPPPLRLDDELIRVLQSVTARTTSGLLELMHVDHLLAGNVFRLPDRELFVAEACSGVHSQLVLIAVSVVLAVVWRRSLLHTVFLVAASVFCAATANTARVLLIVLAAARWGVDLSVGWQHEVLGYSLVAVGLLFLLSADRLLLGLLAPILAFWRAESDPDFDPERHMVPEARDPLSRVWNTLVARRRTAESTTDPLEPEPSPARSEIGSRRLLLICVPFAVLGILQIAVLATAYAPEIRAERMEAAFQKTWLPERVGQWEQKDYQAVQRDLSSDEGQFSRTWVFQSTEQMASVSADFPFLGWHELTRCYQSRGWTEVSRVVRADDETGPYVAVQLSKSNGEAGYLLFSLFDAAARPVPPRTTHWRGIRGKLAGSPLPALFGFGDGTVSPTQTTLQIQQFIAGGYLLDASQREAAEQMYLDFRRRLVSRWQADTAAK